MPKKVQVTAMVEMETYQRLVDLSRQTGKSISTLVREAVEKTCMPEVKSGGEKHG
jgi:predicted DNA-binding protein